MTDGLTCVYVLNLEPRYVRMALTSLGSLRRFDPDVRVVIKVADHPQRIKDTNGERRSLFDLADDVEYLPPAGGDYFPANKTVLRTIDAERIAFIDADTIFFGSIRMLDRRFEQFDVAACPSPWVWRHGYRRSFAPDIYMPLNSGLVVMKRAFAHEWGTVNATRPAELLKDPARGALIGWLRSVNKGAWPRGDLTFSELAWNGQWSVGLMELQDCYLLPRWPNEENPEVWLSAIVLHTYSHLWDACVERLRECGWTDPHRLQSLAQTR